MKSIVGNGIVGIALIHKFKALPHRIEFCLLHSTLECVTRKRHNLFCNLFCVKSIQAGRYAILHHYSKFFLKAENFLRQHEDNHRSHSSYSDRVVLHLQLWQRTCHQTEGVSPHKKNLNYDMSLRCEWDNMMSSLYIIVPHVWHIYKLPGIKNVLLCIVGNYSIIDILLTSRDEIWNVGFLLLSLLPTLQPSFIDTGLCWIKKIMTLELF